LFKSTVIIFIYDAIVSMFIIGRLALQMNRCTVQIILAVTFC